MNRKKKTGAAMGTGITSVLTIMSVLLLLSFAVLSLMSAKSDLLLTEKAATAISEYYDADARAEAWWAELNRTLAARENLNPMAALTAAGYVLEPLMIEILADDGAESAATLTGDAEGGALSVETQDTATAGPGASSPPGSGVTVFATPAAPAEKVPSPDGRMVVRSSFPVNEKKTLEVSVCVEPGGRLSILSWQAVPVYTPR